MNKVCFAKAMRYDRESLACVERLTNSRPGLICRAETKTEKSKRTKTKTGLLGRSGPSRDSPEEGGEYIVGRICETGGF